GKFTAHAFSGLEPGGACLHETGLLRECHRHQRRVQRPSRNYYRSRPPDGCCLRSYPPTARDVSRRRNRSLRSGSIVLNTLRASHLVNASLMPSTLEGCIEKAIRHAHGGVGRHEPCRDTEYVCVVVKACERC